MTERKEREIGKKDQHLYSNLSIKCAESTECGQCFIFNLLLSAPLTSAAPRRLTRKIWESREESDSDFLFNIP